MNTGHPLEQSYEDYKKSANDANSKFLYSLREYCVIRRAEKHKAKKHLHAECYDEIASMIEKHWSFMRG